ncbi:MAG: hypothetical protein QOK15_1758, partial [Nocardioidaceae bacterium]|nr:hypothetical protein [Nocardioidaceae bacterium]
SEAAASRVLTLTDGVDENRYQHVLELLVRVRCERGDMRAAMETARLQLQRAEDVGDPRAIATAHASLGMALLLADHVQEAARHYETACEGAAALGDVVLEIHALSDLAGCRHAEGSFATCIDLLTRARELAERISYRRHLAYNLLNEAELRSTLGDPAAGACAAVAVQRSLGLGDPGAAANAVHTWVGSDPHLVVSARVWRRLLDVELTLGRWGYAAEAGVELALAEARTGHASRARRDADDATRRMDPAEQPQVQLRADLARLLAAAGPRVSRTPGQSAALLDGLSDLAGGGGLTEVQRAEIAVERWRATRDEHDREAATELLQAAFAVEPSAVVRSWCLETSTVPTATPPPLPPPVGIARLRTTRHQFDDALSAVEAAATHQGLARSG